MFVFSVKILALAIPSNESKLFYHKINLRHGEKKKEKENGKIIFR